MPENEVQVGLRHLKGFRRRDRKFLTIDFPASKFVDVDDLFASKLVDIDDLFVGRCRGSLRRKDEAGLGVCVAFNLHRRVTERR